MRTPSVMAFTPILALSLACDVTGPASKDLAEFILDFCSTETPAFVAFQNDGGPWTRVMPSAGGTVAINATPKFALAVAGEEAGIGPFVDVVYAARDEFSALNGASCLEQSGSKVLSGSALGLVANASALISMSTFNRYFEGSAQYQFDNLPERPLDLIAHRNPNFSVPDVVVVRRAVSFTSGATLSPQLDFNSGVALAANTLTITGLAVGATTYYSIGFRTLSGTDHPLHSSTFFTTTSSQPLFGIPASLTQSGDLHDINVLSVASNSTARGVTQFNRNPGDRTAALGPPLNSPAVSNAGTTPTLRLRAQLTSQTEYGGFGSVNFSQTSGTVTRNFSVTRTSGYTDGTPATWDLEMPDLTGVSGFPSSAAFVNGVTATWFTEAGSGGADVFLGGSGVDGLIVKFADRSSDSSPMEISRTPGASARARGRFVRHFRSRLD